MSRLAIFVEGQTELVFMERLLFELLGYQGLRVERERFAGDIFSELSARGSPEDAATHTVLIVDCTGDGNVLSAMLDRADRLQRAGWAAVIGLRDLFRNTFDEIEEIDIGARGLLEAKAIPCELFFAVDEIEAWFLADPTHISRYDAGLTVERVRQELGVDLYTADIEGIRHPAALLEKIYGLVGGVYTKKLRQAHAVADLLDYTHLWLAAPNKMPYMKRFFDRLGTLL